jgi:hypothetical protein
VARPDREVRHEPACCSRCGAGLAGAPVTSVQRRRVLDLPLVRAVTDVAPAGDWWCWAAQAAEAITAMQRLVSEAIARGQALNPGPSQR